MNDKYPLRITVGDGADQRFKLSTTISKIDRSSKNVRSELAYLADDYHILVQAVRECLAEASPGAKADPRLIWLAGDHLTNFLSRIDDLGFYLVRQNDTLARDMGVPALAVQKVLAFRKRCLKLSMVDPAVPWEEVQKKKTVRRAPKPAS